MQMLSSNHHAAGRLAEALAARMATLQARAAALGGQIDRTEDESLADLGQRQAAYNLLKPLTTLLSK